MEQYGVTIRKKHFGGIIEKGMQQVFQEKHAPLMLKNCLLQAGDESWQSLPVLHDSHRKRRASSSKSVCLLQFSVGVPSQPTSGVGEGRNQIEIGQFSLRTWRV